MKLLSNWKDYVTSGRVRVDCGDGIILDTNEIAGDTGLIDITSSFGVTGAAEGNVTLRRVGKTVELSCYGRRLTSNTATTNEIVYTLPIGFRADTNKMFANPMYPTLAGNRAIVSTSIQMFGFNNLQTYFTMSWMTTDRWPTSY